MKKFLQIDFWVQLTAFIVIVTFLIIIYLVNAKTDYFFLFYFVIGGLQLLSTIIKSFDAYKKSILYKIYVIGIMPVWLSLILIPIFGNFNLPIEVLYYIWIYGSILSPLFAILFILDSYLSYKNYEKSNL